jgi:hypothetical protein
VSEGESPDCAQETKAAEENEAGKEATTDGAKPAADAKAAPKVKSKTAGSRRLPTFLRRVDNFLQGRR